MNFKITVVIPFLFLLIGCGTITQTSENKRDENIYFIHKTQPISVEVNISDLKNWDIGTLLESFSGWKTVGIDDVTALKKSNNPLRKTCRIKGVFLEKNKGVGVSCEVASIIKVNGWKINNYEYSVSLDNIRNLAGVAENPNLYFIKYKFE